MSEKWPEKRKIKHQGYMWKVRARMWNAAIDACRAARDEEVKALRSLAELIVKFEETEGLSSHALGTLIDFAREALKRQEER